MKRLTAAALAALALHAPALAQEEVTVLAVEVPVQVLVSGKPVRNLTAQDFEILEGRRPLAITDFEVVDLASATAASPAAAAPLPPSGRRHFLLLFDLAYAEPTAVVKAREAAKRVVTTQLHATDLVGVARYRPSKGMELVLGFTPDRTQVAAAIDTLGFVEVRDRKTYSEPLLLTLTDVIGTDPTGGNIAGDGELGSGLAALLIEQLKDLSLMAGTAARRDQANEAAIYTESLTAAGRLMGAVKGRKHVVLLSQGFDPSLLTGTTDQGVIAEDSDAAIFGEVWKVDSEERYGDTRSRTGFTQLIESLRRADCVIQAVDIGGLKAGGSAQEAFGDPRHAGGNAESRAPGRETLFTLARDTGGQLYERINDLDDAMGQMLEATSVTYVLTVHPQDVRPDGKFHPIKVRLKGGPAGAQLVHRPGYYAPRRWSDRPAAERRLETAQLLVAGEPGGSLAAGVVAAPFRTAGERVHVPVVFAVDGGSVLAAGVDGKAALSFYAYAFDERGDLRDFVAQNVGFDLAPARAKLEQGSLKFAGDLLLPPGRYTLRALVQMANSGRHWLGAVPLQIDGPQGGPQLSPPLFPEPMTAGIVTRSSASAEKTKGLPFPFTLGEGFFLPDPMPVVAAGQLGEAVVIGALPPGDLRVEGELVAPDGKVFPISEAGVAQRLASQQPGAAGIESFVVRFRSAPAPPGEYILKLRLLAAGSRYESSAHVRLVA